MRQLFIVTDNGIYFGRDNLHKNLAERISIKKEHILGGGVFQQGKDQWILFGESQDFGKFDTELLQLFIDEKKLFWFKSPLPFEVEFIIDEDRVETSSDEF